MIISDTIPLIRVISQICSWRKKQLTLTNDADFQLIIKPDTKFTQMFCVIKTYISWDDFELLEIIIERFGNDELKQWMEEYRNKYRAANYLFFLLRCSGGLAGFLAGFGLAGVALFSNDNKTYTETVGSYSITMLTSFFHQHIMSSVRLYFSLKKTTKQATASSSQKSAVVSKKCSLLITGGSCLITMRVVCDLSSLNKCCSVKKVILKNHNSCSMDASPVFSLNDCSLDCFSMDNDCSLDCFSMDNDCSLDCFSMDNDCSLDCFSMDNDCSLDCLPMEKCCFLTDNDCFPMVYDAAAVEVTSLKTLMSNSRLSDNLPAFSLLPNEEKYLGSGPVAGAGAPTGLLLIPLLSIIFFCLIAPLQALACRRKPLYIPYIYIQGAQVYKRWIKSLFLTLIMYALLQLATNIV